MPLPRASIPPSPFPALAFPAAIVGPTTPVPIPLRPFLVPCVQLSPGQLRVRADRDVISHRRDGGRGRGGAAVAVAVAFDRPPNRQLEDVPGCDHAQTVRVTVHYLRPRRTSTSPTVRREHFHPRWRSVVTASIEIFVFAIIVLIVVVVVVSECHVVLLSSVDEDFDVTIDRHREW